MESTKNYSTIYSISPLLNIDCTPSLLEYYSLQHFFNLKYGNNTIVLMQKGAFYEIYQYNPDDEASNYLATLSGNVAIKLNLKENNLTSDLVINFNKSLGHAIKLANILRIKLTSVDGNKVHGINNPYMCGIPKIVYSNHRDTLLLNGYTVIRVDEIGKVNNVIQRQIAEISSPGTEIETITSYVPKTTNGLMAIYLEYIGSKNNIDKTLIVSGLAYIDNANAENYVHEVYSQENDEAHAIQEIYRYLACKRPAEIIIYLSKFPNNKIEEYKKYYIANLELNNYTKYQFYFELNPQFLTLNYQEKFLENIFPQPGLTQGVPGLINHSQKLNTIIDQLDLAKLNYGRIAYIALLYYVYEHNNNLLKNLSKPIVEWLDQAQNLILTNNALYQLNLFDKNISITNILNNQDIDSLIKILDQCKTDMGSRFLRKRLLNPITSVDRLNLAYQITQELLNIDIKHVNHLAKILTNIDDIERLQRLIQLDLIKPTELYKLILSYQEIIKLYDYINNQDCFVELKKLLPAKAKYQTFLETLAYLTKVLDLDNLKKTKITKNVLSCQNSFIKNGYYSEHDQILNYWQQYEKYLQQVCEHLNQILPKGVKNRDIKVVFNGDEDINIGIITNQSKADKLVNNHELNVSFTGALKQHKITKDKIMLKSELIDQACNQLETLHQQLELHLYQIYRQIIEMLKNQDFDLIKFITQTDFLYNNAKLAITHKYSKPVIVNHDHAYLKVQELRHPLIEKIIKNEYISNDLSLGHMLLYGVNSCGKSSLLKSVGLIIIMAQAGLYVPGKLEFYPYTKILTRLSGNDDIFKGKSSFIIELEELAIILKNADSNSLVLIDELCKGSERDSAIALTVSTIDELIERKSSFILTSHIHELLEVEEIKKLNNLNTDLKSSLQVKHLAVKYDEKLDLLIYDRKLLDGPIDKLYGIEVAKSLNLDRKFIDKTLNIRNRLVGQDVKIDLKTSHYNSEVIVNNCALCQSKINLQTHHLKEQHLADESGKIGYYHKNSSFNLVVLCQKCHMDLHAKNQELNVKQTLNGSMIIKN